MYTMNTISDAITLAYKSEKQKQASSRISYQRPSRSYSTPLSLEPKHEPQTPHPRSHLTSQKEPLGTFTSPVNKPNFIPIRNNPRKFPENQTHNPYAKPLPIRCYRCGIPGHRSNECNQRSRTFGLLEDNQGKQQSGPWLEDGVIEEIVVPDEGDKVLCLANSDQMEEGTSGLFILKSFYLHPGRKIIPKEMPFSELDVQSKGRSVT